MNRDDVKAAVAEQAFLRAQRHAAEHPDGCPDWCVDCQRRLGCKNNRHEWPRNYSDGDTCFCGGFYLFANSVDDRPHVIVSGPDGAH